mgnify:CR=1 FL=1
MCVTSLNMNDNIEYSINITKFICTDEDLFWTVTLNDKNNYAYFHRIINGQVEINNGHKRELERISCTKGKGMERTYRVEVIVGFFI